MTLWYQIPRNSEFYTYCSEKLKKLLWMSLNCRFSKRAIKFEKNLQRTGTDFIKFIHSEKATQILVHNITTKKKIAPNFCGLLRKLY